MGEPVLICVFCMVPCNQYFSVYFQAIWENQFNYLFGFLFLLNGSLPVLVPVWFSVPIVWFPVISISLYIFRQYGRTSSISCLVSCFYRMIPCNQYFSVYFQAIWENQFYYLFGFLFLLYGSLLSVFLCIFSGNMGEPVLFPVWFGRTSSISCLVSCFYRMVPFNQYFAVYFQAIWENQFYYLFGFLFLVFIILIISVSQISIVMVYFQLCGEVRGLLRHLLMF